MRNLCIPLITATGVVMSNCAYAQTPARLYSVDRVASVARATLGDRARRFPFGRQAALIYFPRSTSRSYEVFLEVYDTQRAAVLSYRDFGPVFRKRGDVVVRLANVVIDAAPLEANRPVPTRLHRAMASTVKRLVARLRS